MKKWNWILSADFDGKWITTGGFASLNIADDNLEADLVFDQESEVYHHIKGSISDGFAEVVVTSPGRDIDSFKLAGPYFGDTSNKTFVLTDGSTILGITHGPESGSRNL